LSRSDDQDDPLIVARVGGRPGPLHNLGHFDVAINQYRKALDMGFQAYFVHTNLAAAYAQAGKMDDAKAELAEARRLNPVWIIGC
jgi:tetratricopeptide (TPR) repeat protein